MIPVDKPNTISNDKLSAITGLTYRRHKQLADAGFVPKPDRGRWPTLETLRGLFDYYRRDYESKRGLHVEKLRSEKLRADLLELELEEEQNRLIPMDFAIDCLADLIIGITQKIKGSSLSELEKAEILKDVRSLNVRAIVKKRGKNFRRPDAEDT